ncbi:Uncharacterised protein [Streptococcus pneumoniae]|nr:Uncharacterised protein [Streptococcus pneumoniae]
MMKTVTRPLLQQPMILTKTLMTALTISMTEIIQKIVVGQTGLQHHLLIQKYQRV